MKLDTLTRDEAARLYTDERAARKFEDETLYGGPSSLTPQERDAIESFVSEHCQSREELSRRFEEFLEKRRAEVLDRVDDLRLAAAQRGRPRSAERTPEEQEDVTFVFAAHFGADDREAWRAELTVPAVAAANTMLPITLSEGGSPIVDGFFKIAGISLPVIDGKASLPLGVFLAGMRKPEVEFSDSEGKTLKGNLVFF